MFVIIYSMKKPIKIFVAAVVCVVSIVMLFACAGSASTEYDTVKKTKAENFVLLNETAEKGQIVMIGDSIVELYPTYELFRAYPTPENPLIVYNRGISGDTSDRMLERLETNALNIQPKVLSILIGTNDFKRLTKEETLRNVRSAIEKAKSSGVSKIILQSLYPVNKRVDSSMVGVRTNETIQEYNEAYRALAAETGAVYADVFSILTDDNGNYKEDLTYDGLHPNAKCYVLISEFLKPILSSDAD